LLVATTAAEAVVAVAATTAAAVVAVTATVVDDRHLIGFGLR